MTPKMSACSKLASQKSFIRRLDTVEMTFSGAQDLPRPYLHSDIEKTKTNTKAKTKTVSSENWSYSKAQDLPRPYPFWDIFRPLVGNLP